MLGTHQLDALQEGGQALDGDVQGGHERGADPAVLRAAVRPLGGLRGRAPKLLTFLRDNVKNVVFLTTDVHANLVNDARLKTLEAAARSTPASSR